MLKHQPNCSFHCVHRFLILIAKPSTHHHLSLSPPLQQEEETMRDRMEKLVLLPFAVGCMSESSIAVAGQPPRRSKASNSDLPLALRSDHQERTDQHDNQEEEEGSFSDESPKSSLSLLALPKPSISTGIHRLYKGVRSFSSLFMYKEEDMEEEEEMEIEIGLPTDVKHVTHIGWDGYVTADINPINLNALDSLIPPHHPPGDDDGHDTDRPFTSADVAPLLQLDGHSKFRPIA